MERFKSQALLFIYNRLKEGKVVRKSDVLDKFNINERSFYRYIKDIKDFIDKEFISDMVRQEVVSDKEKGGYVLKGKQKENLNEKEVLAISKVLLESKGFIKSEMKDIVNKLLDNCVSEDKENIRCIIDNELVNYVPLQHKKELLDKLWKISNSIKDQKILEIGYCKVGSQGKVEEEVSRRTVCPQGLLFSEYYFYLVAFIEGKSYEYPTIYRVDRIKDLIVTDEKYKVEYSKRFQDGEFRKLIQFMQTGKIERVKFKFTGKSIEAVLDRLPNANIVKAAEGEYVVEANMFGKGIKMWLLSQGEYIEVMGPQDFKDDIKRTIENMCKLYK